MVFHQDPKLTPSATLTLRIIRYWIVFMSCVQHVVPGKQTRKGRSSFILYGGIQWTLETLVTIFIIVDSHYMGQLAYQAMGDEHLWRRQAWPPLQHCVPHFVDLKRERVLQNSAGLIWNTGKGWHLAHTWSSISRIMNNPELQAHSPLSPHW